MAQQVDVCRFCLDEEHEGDNGNFVDDPCLCRGSTKCVHLKCLEKAFVVRNHWHNFQCPTCKQCYQGVALRRLAELSYAQMMKSFGEYSLQVAHSLCYLAQGHLQVGDFDKSKEILEQRLDIEERVLGVGHVVTSSTLSDLAAVNGKLGGISLQKTLLERSLSIKEAHHGVGHISTAVVLNNLAVACNELGEPAQERELLEKSLSIRERHYGTNHVQLTPALVNLASVHSELGNASKSCELLRGVLAIEQQHFGVGHLETAITLHNLALVCGQTGDLEGMRRYLEQSLSIKERHYGKNHFESSLTLANLSIVHCFTGDRVLANKVIDQALSTCGKCAPPSRRCGLVLLCAAVIHRCLGQIALAESFALHATEVMTEVMGADAAAKMLKAERARIANIWAASAREDEFKRLVNCLDQDSDEFDVMSTSTCISTNMSSVCTCSNDGELDEHEEERIANVEEFDDCIP